MLVSLNRFRQQLVFTQPQGQPPRPLKWRRILAQLLFVSLSLNSLIQIFDFNAPVAAAATAPTASFQATQATGAKVKPRKISPKDVNGLHVSGNQILNGANQPLRLVGANRTSTEYACIQDWGFFSGPSDDNSVSVMASWNIDAVRVPLNEDCWLAINGAPAAYSGANYQTVITNYVNLLNGHGIIAILDLHWSGAGATKAEQQEPMADEDHAPAFWTSVANTFKSNSSVIFDLYNEPYPDNNSNSTAAWTCLRDGGNCTGVPFVAAGMQELVNTVRATGATNIIMVGGVNYANSLSEWLTYKPTDPTGNLVASWHSYDTERCNDTTCWDNEIAPVLAQVPVITGEIGEDYCQHTYIDGLMNWLDSKQSNYMAWAWIVTPCDNAAASDSLSLITDYNGTPTQVYGQGFHDHLATILTEPAATTTALVNQPNPSLVGQTVTLQATVSNNQAGGATPDGSVTFSNTTSGTMLGSATLSNGVATLTTSFASAGGFLITASYGGTPNFAASSGTVTQQVTSAGGATPSQIEVAGGNNQSAHVSTAFATNLKVIVRDASNSPLAGISVTFNASASGASGVFAGTNTNTATAISGGDGSATAPILTANSQSGNFTVTASVAGVATPATFNLTNLSVGTPPPPPPTTYTYYLPFLANAANGYTTYIVFQNLGSSTATFSLKYLDDNGSTVSGPALSGSCANLVAHAECLPPSPYAAGKSGSGILTSNQPLNVIVAEATLYGGSAYAVSEGGHNNLIAPLILRNAYGDFSTRLTVFNGGTQSAQVTVTFYDSNGQAQPSATQTFTIGAGTRQTLDQSVGSNGLPDGFNGWAQISSAAGNSLVTQVLEQSPSQHFVAIASAQSAPSTTLYAPAIFKGAFGFNTGANIVNPGNAPVQVAITYYDGNSGTAYPAPAFTLAPNAVASIYQGAGGGQGLPAAGLPAGFSGAATVNVSGGGAVMAVNESGGVSASGTSISGVYGGASAAGGKIGLPVMANGGYGFTTGATILNTSNSSVSGTIQYYNSDGTSQGSAQAFSIAPHASKLVYQGDSASGLQNGFYGTALVTESGGQDLIVTTNALSNLFYTYTETGI